MFNFFYLKLAIDSIKKNKVIYFPFILVSSLCASTFYLLVALGNSSDVSNSQRAGRIVSLLNFGGYVIAILSICFILYANSFLIKRRKKELGLFGILGLEKKHIVVLLVLESAICYGICLLITFVISLVFGKFGYLILIKTTGLNIDQDFLFSFVGLIKTVIFYFVIFALLAIENIRQVHFVGLIDLIKGEQLGEKEPKANWFMAIIGFCSLVAGYVLALTIKEPNTAILLFFIAVIFVVIGTYLIFISGSIFVLKQLKKNKAIYYKSRNFFSISSLIYRMKQNATGLASICILSTMVLVTISSTIGIYASIDELVNNEYDYDVRLSFYSGLDSQQLNDDLDNASEKSGLQVQNLIRYRQLYTYGGLIDNTVYSPEDLTSEYQFTYVYFIPLEDYNDLSNQQYILEADEVLLFTTFSEFGYEDIILGSSRKSLHIKAELTDFPIAKKEQDSTIENRIYLVVADEVMGFEYMNVIDDREYDDYYAFTNNISFDLSGSMNEKLQFEESLSYYDIMISKADGYMDYLSFYGTLLFLGLFLGVAFLFGTILIIYYKQISEGYADADRYLVLQKIGMEHKEVKKTIQRQIIIFFFLPLVMAIMHSLFAFHMISTALKAMNMVNTGLLLGCLGVTIAVFSLIYFVVYRYSARVYYKIVRY